MSDLITNTLTKSISSTKESEVETGGSDITDAVLLCIMTGLGLFGNLLMIISIIGRRSLRKIINMFLLHHCFINFVQCLLYIPFILALLNDTQLLRGCEIIGGMFVTMVTATVLNIAAMTACEAYRFEDLVQEQNEVFQESTSSIGSFKIKSKGLDQKNYSNGTGSYTCVLFGIFMIWLSSIILHLGMTLIGSDAKQFYNYKIRNCFLVIGDKQTYILYIMWILLTTVSLVLTIIYVKRIYKDVAERKFQDKSNFFITSPLFYEKKSLIANSTVLSESPNEIKEKSSLVYNIRPLEAEELKKTNKFSNSYDSINNIVRPNFSPQTNNNHNNNIHKSDRLFSLSSKSASKIKRPTTKKLKSGTLTNNDNILHSNIALGKCPRLKKRRFDFVKLIMQRIKIQLLVIKLFIICWLPLFFTVLIDTQFKISPNIYRYLILIAFSNSSLTPYCYLTILMPCINKYCLPCLRTDGRQSKVKTLYYNEMERYYEKLGDRMHNLSGHSSLSSINFQSNNHESSAITAATSVPPPNTKNSHTPLWKQKFVETSQIQNYTNNTNVFSPIKNNKKNSNGRDMNHMELSNFRSLSYNTTDIADSAFIKKPAQNGRSKSYRVHKYENYW